MINSDLKYERADIAFNGIPQDKAKNFKFHFEHQSGNGKKLQVKGKRHSDNPLFTTSL